jgi:hypothetical protein
VYNATCRRARHFLRLALVRDPLDGPQIERPLLSPQRPATAVVLAQERLHVLGQLAVHLRLGALDLFVRCALRHETDISQ